MWWNSRGLEAQWGKMMTALDMVEVFLAWAWQSSFRKLGI